jgi:hypothetical protein
MKEYHANEKHEPEAAKPPQASLGIARSIVLYFVGCLVLYVLSFGPICRLTASVLAPDAVGQGVHVARQAKFPTWGRWAQVVYRPLFAVMGGHAGPFPKEVLFWYVRLWG